MRSLLTVVFLLALIPTVGHASELYNAIQLLAPGQSARLTTNNQYNSVYASPDTDTYLSWGNTGLYDNSQGKAYWIGKMHGGVQWNKLVYDEATNTFSIDTDVPAALQPPLNLAGHGWDNNAMDPKTGDIYLYVQRSDTPDEPDFYFWDASKDSWGTAPSNVPGLSTDENAIAMEWWDGKGLVLSCEQGVYIWDKGTDTWTKVASGYGVDFTVCLHSVGQYSQDAGVYVFGGGKWDTCDSYNKFYKMDTSYNITVMDDSFTNLKIASNTVGLLVNDPASDKFIGWRWYGANASAAITAWGELDPVSGEWTSLTPVSGDGQDASGNPQAEDGVPNIEWESNSNIAIPLEEYGAMMFIPTGATNGGSVWVYKHTATSSAVSGSLLQSFD